MRLRNTAKIVEAAFLSVRWNCNIAKAHFTVLHG